MTVDIYQEGGEYLRTIELADPRAQFIQSYNEINPDQRAVATAAKKLGHDGLPDTDDDNFATRFGQEFTAVDEERRSQETGMYGLDIQEGECYRITYKDQPKSSVHAWMADIVAEHGLIDFYCLDSGVYHSCLAESIESAEPIIYVLAQTIAITLWYTTAAARLTQYYAFPCLEPRLMLVHPSSIA